MSCCVGCMRVKMLRRLICMVSRLSGGRKNSTFSSSRSSEAKKASSCCFGAGADFCGMANGSSAPLVQLEPFVGDDHHGLRQIERGEGRIDRQRDDAVGERHLVVLEPVALAAEHEGDGFAGGDARRHLGGRLGRRRSTGLAWSWARAVVASTKLQSAMAASSVSKSTAPSRMRSAPAAIMRALSFGQPCRGLTRRSRDRPKFAMARAAAPIFSPSCGSTRTTTGAGPFAPSSWSCRCRRPACSAPRRANALKAQPLPKPSACVKRRHRIQSCAASPTAAFFSAGGLSRTC